MLERLAQGLQGVTPKLRQIIKKEDTVVGQAYLAGPWVGAAADHAR
jgi:hypothetical protein